MKTSVPQLWSPPADGLVWRAPLWVSAQAAELSYPEHGNDACFSVEDRSYWFRHRTATLLALFEKLPPTGTFLDLGGGNGQFVAALQQSGRDAALLEPGRGVHNALRRGAVNVIHSTFEDARFRRASLGSVGAFDVLEHLRDDEALLHQLRGAMQPGARFYGTVPAGPWLWSADDEAAGHFRRYTPASLSRTLQRSGFILEFLSPLFTWLPLPVFLLRALPSRLRWRRATSAAAKETIESDHRLPTSLAPLVERLHAWERRRIRAGRPLPSGTSLLCVARVPS